MNVLVTVGTQLSFDRLINAVDDWADSNKLVSIFAQTNLSDYRAKNVECVAFLDSDEFQARIEWADVIVAHAGMGSIITALQYGIPIIILSRQVSLGEHRNDHQLATVKRFSDFNGIYAANDDSEVAELLDSVKGCSGSAKLSLHASDRLIESVREFIWQEK